MLDSYREIVVAIDEYLKTKGEVRDEDFTHVVDMVAGHSTAEHVLRQFGIHARVSDSTMNRWVMGTSCPRGVKKKERLLVLRRVLTDS